METSDTLNSSKSHLEIMMVGAVLNCFMSFIPLPRDIVRMDEVVMSSREMKEEKIPTWDAYLMESPSSKSMRAWNEMRHCKSSLGFVSKKSIPLTKISFRGNRNDFKDGERMFENIRLEKLIEADFADDANFYFMLPGEARPKVSEEGVLRDIDLVDFFKTCPNLQKVRLCHRLKISDNCLRAIAQNCLKLKSLDINRCESMTDAGVIAIVEACRDLEDVNLGHEINLYQPFDDGRYFSDASVKALAGHCPKLKRINIGGCVLMTDVAIIALAERCGELQKIDMSRCGKTTNASLKRLGILCPALEEIDVSMCRRITEAGVKNLAKGCVKLRVVDISDTKALTDNAVTAISQNCRNLVSLNIRSCRENPMTDACLVAIANNCRHLEFLSVGDGSKITEAGRERLNEKYPDMQIVGDDEYFGDF